MAMCLADVGETLRMDGVVHPFACRIGPGWV
jgi:hypothetical protein